MSQTAGEPVGTPDSAAPAPLAPGQAAFYDSVVPALPAGDYQIIVQDTVEVDQQAQAPYATVQRFRVTGPRVTLAPGDVVAMSPPAGSQGTFDTWLPHVVLGQRSLPWQVPIADVAGSGPPASPAQPWLALLLLTSQEIDVAGAPPAVATTGMQTVPLSAYLAPPAGTLGPVPTIGLHNLQAEQPGLTCSIVDVSFEAFRAVAPKAAELPFLVHVRQVDPSDQEILQVPSPGWYSVVIGNRFPVGAPDNLYIAHLVSLEGFARYLPDQPAPAGFSLVRLVSLASWSFTSGPDPGDFAYLMENLGVDSLTVPVTIPATSPAGQRVASAVAGGYTLLGYTSRLGEHTAAWYRGPCQPAPVPANPQPAYPAASAALIYDPATGMFDASYAAAWEIGRLLTLANGPVALSLANWSGSVTSATRLLLERTRAAPAGEPAPAGAPALAPTAWQRAARQLIAEQVVPALLGRDGARPALGSPADPTGLRGRHLPGLVDAETLHQLVSDGGDAYERVREHVIATAQQQAPASSPPDGPVPQQGGS